MKANNNNPYINESGYFDETMGRAICKVSKDGKIKPRYRDRDADDVMHLVKRLLDITDFKLENRLTLVDKQTGKRYE